VLGGSLVALSSPRVAFLVVGVGAASTTAVFVVLTMRGLEPTAAGAGVAAAEAPVREAVAPAPEAVAPAPESTPEPSAP